MVSTLGASHHGQALCDRSPGPEGAPVLPEEWLSVTRRVYRRLSPCTSRTESYAPQRPLASPAGTAVDLRERRGLPHQPGSTLFLFGGTRVRDPLDSACRPACWTERVTSFFQGASGSGLRSWCFATLARVCSITSREIMTSWGGVICGVFLRERVVSSREADGVKGQKPSGLCRCALPVRHPIPGRPHDRL